MSERRIAALKYVREIIESERAVNSDEFSTVEYAQSEGISTSVAYHRLKALENRGILVSRLRSSDSHSGHVMRFWRLADAEEGVT